MQGLLLQSDVYTKVKNLQHYILETVWRTRQLWAVPVLMIGGFVFGIAGGLMVVRLPSEVSLALIGLTAFLLAFSRPDFIILLILMLSSTLFNSATIRHFFGFSAVDLGVMFLLGIVLFRVISNKGGSVFVRTPLDWPLFLFFGASTISLLNGIYFLETVDLFRNIIWRVLMNYLIFFAVSNLVETRQQLMTLVNGMLVMATIVAGFMIVQQAVGPSVSIIPGQERVVLATGVGQRAISGVARLSIDGSSLVFVMLLPAIILHTTPDYLKRRKWLSFIPVALLPLAIAFTFDRNFWIGATLGGLIFILISRFSSKRFILLIVTLAIGAISTVSLLNDYFPRIDTVVGGLTLRFSSLFAGDELVQDSSTQWRLRENEVAIPAIQENPVLGLGPGAQWRAPWNNRDRLTRYIHNGYLFLLLNVGVIGLLPFLWFSIGHVVTGFRAWFNLKDQVLKSLVIGFAVSYIAVLSSSMTSPRFLESEFVILLGLMLGINQVAIRLELHQTPHTNQI